MKYSILVLLVLFSGFSYSADFGTCTVGGSIYSCLPTSVCISSPTNGIPTTSPNQCQFENPDNPGDTLTCCVTGPAESTYTAPISQCSQLDGNWLQRYSLHRKTIDDAIVRSGLDRALVGTGYNPQALAAALITHESARTWDPEVKSPCGSVGIMQMIPATARSMGLSVPQYEREYCSDICIRDAGIREVSVCNSCTPEKCQAGDERMDATKSIYAGTQYLANQIRECNRLGKDLRTGVAAYNSGNCNGESNPNYVTSILDNYYPKWLNCLGPSFADDVSLDQATTTVFGSCDAPLADYSCQRLNVDGSCPTAGQVPVPGMCPRYPNNIQCCAAEEETQTNPYGNCQDNTFSEFQCQRVTKLGNGYVCPGDMAETHDALAGMCPGASFIQCCVPKEIRQEKFESGEYAKCSGVLNKYDCTKAESCSTEENVIYTDFCPASTICCVPKSDHVEKFYIYDNANVIEDDTETSINQILGSLENDLVEDQIPMPVVIQTELDNPDVNENFVRMRHQELLLDKTYPSALIVLKLTTDGDTVKHEIKRYSASGPFSTILESMIYYDDETTQYLDRGEYTNGFLSLAKDIQVYAKNYGKLVQAAKNLADDQSCNSFKNGLVAAVETLSVNEYTKSVMVEQIAKDADKACDNYWRKAVKAELEAELKRLDAGIQYLEIAKRFDRDNPVCNKEQEFRYACIKNANDNTYDIRVCQPQQDQLELTQNTVGITVDSPCEKNFIASDDFFDSDNGQIRCGVYQNSFRLLQCKQVGDGYLWKPITSSGYSTLEACAGACSNRQFCTEPRLTLVVGDRVGFIQNGQTVERLLNDITITSTNQNNQQSKLGTVYHAVKYKIFVNGQLFKEDRNECQNSDICKIVIPSILPGSLVQYWSEVSFEEAAAATYIRSPASGVYYFTTEGRAEITDAVQTNAEFGYEWERESEKFSTSTECKAACSIQYMGQCITIPQSEEVDEGTSNILEAARGAYNKDQLIAERTIVGSLLSCYTRRNVGLLELQQMSSQQMIQLCGNAPSLSFLENYNPRYTFLVNVEKDMANYRKNPDQTACRSAVAASLAVAETSTTMFQYPTYSYERGFQTNDFNLYTDLQRRQAAYNLVIEKCVGLEGDEFNGFVENAVSQSQSLNSGFISGSMNVVQSFGEPHSVALIGGAVLLTGVSRVWPAAGVAAAARVESAVNAIHSGVAAYFAVEMTMALPDAITACRQADISSDKCGEAITQAGLMLGLIKSGYKHGRVSVELYKGERGLVALQKEIVDLQKKVAENEIAIAAKRADVETRLNTLRQGEWYNRQRYEAELEKINKDRAALDDLERKNGQAKELLEKNKGPQEIALLSELIEKGKLDARFRKSKQELLSQEMKSVIDQRERSGQRITCVTGAVTGMVGCGGGKSPLNEDFAREASRRLDEMFGTSEKPGEVAKIKSQPSNVFTPDEVIELEIIRPSEPVPVRPKIASDLIEINRIKQILVSQEYVDGSGTHVTPLRNAIQIAKENALQPSEKSGQVDVYVKIPNQPINLVNYGGSTSPVVIEIPAVEGFRQVTNSNSGGIAGKALEQGKSYVTVDDARFHTIDGPPGGYSRTEFLERYG